MTPYIPERMLLWVEHGRNPSVTDLPARSIPWKDRFPRLTGLDQRILFLEGQNAIEMFAFFDKKAAFRLVNQGGIDYTVLIDVVLPHEEVSNSYEQ